MVGTGVGDAHGALVSCDGRGALVSRDGCRAGDADAEEAVVFAWSVWESSCTGHSPQPPPAN